MRRFLGVGCCAVIASLLGLQAATASDDIGAIADSLKRSPVYVSPADAPLANRLLGSLQHGDTILLVSLPASDAPSADALDSFEAQLATSVGPSHVIGVVAGDNVAASSSTWMPDETAKDLMLRAHNVNSNPGDILTTFVQNVHGWQRSNPAPKVASPHTGSTNGPVIFVIILVGALLIGAVYLFRRVTTPIPRRIADALKELKALTEKVSDDSFRKRLAQCWERVEYYFLHSPNTDNAAVFAIQLGQVREVLEQYLQIQSEPQYFAKADQEMAKARAALDSFASQVIQAIRENNEVTLVRFNLNVKNL